MRQGGQEGLWRQPSLPEECVSCFCMHCHLPYLCASLWKQLILHASFIKHTKSVFSSPSEYQTVSVSSFMLLLPVFSGSHLSLSGGGACCHWLELFLPPACFSCLRRAVAAFPSLLSLSTIIQFSAARSIMPAGAEGGMHATACRQCGLGTGLDTCSQSQAGVLAWHFYLLQPDEQHYKHTCLFERTFSTLPGSIPHNQEAVISLHGHSCGMEAFRRGRNPLWSNPHVLMQCLLSTDLTAGRTLKTSLAGRNGQTKGIPRLGHFPSLSWERHPAHTWQPSPPPHLHALDSGQGGIIWGGLALPALCLLPPPPLPHLPCPGSREHA